jgi:hypothetical protein
MYYNSTYAGLPDRKVKLSLIFCMGVSIFIEVMNRINSHVGNDTLLNVDFVLKVINAKALLKVKGFFTVAI